MSARNRSRGDKRPSTADSDRGDENFEKLGLEINRGKVVGPDPSMTSNKFKRQMEYFFNKGEIDKVKLMRVGTWLETRHAITKRSNLSEPPKHTLVTCSARNCKPPFRSFSIDKVASRQAWRAGERWSLRKLSSDDICSVDVVEEDTLHCASRLYNETDNPTVGVLNMACHLHAGGGLLHGAGAQEENLCRRTNLMNHLGSVKYPLDIGTCAVSKRVHYFRGPEDVGYPFLRREEQKKFVVLSSAAYAGPPTINGKSLGITHAAGIYLTMCAIVRGGKQAGCNVLVLSALGCGAYGTPPKDVARLFSYAIKNEGFEGKIVFAILPDHRNGDENAKIFRAEFSQSPWSVECKNND